MPTLPEALDAQFSARFELPGLKRPATHRQGLTARMNALVKANGGEYRRAAASAGIPERTWRDWRNGTHPPSARGLRKLETAYGRQILRPALAKLIAAGKFAVREIHVKATVVCDPKKGKYKNSQPYRWFRAEKIDTGKVVTAWINHGSEAAAQAYEASVQEQYRQQFAFEGVNVEVDLS